MAPEYVYFCKIIWRIAVETAEGFIHSEATRNQQLVVTVVTEGGVNVLPEVLAPVYSV
jgi:hypothetical protein